MKFSQFTLVAMLLAGVSSFATSNNSASEPSSEPGTVSSATSDSTTVDYAKEKEEFQTTMKKRLAEVEKNIEVLEKKAKSASAEASVKIDEQLKVLEAKRKTLSRDLDRLSAKSGRAWTELRTGVVKAWEELKTAVNKTANEIGKDESEK